ncbi:hypothetical protein LguiB_018374 [Lonicera macranthoides]
MDDVPSQDSESDSNNISLPLIIGILSSMFLIFIFLLYCNFCRRRPSVVRSNIPLTRSTSISSGIDKTVIDSFPSFKFSWLKGFCEGLECTICLSKFEDAEILRLLPKCKHAFHMACADQWLERHSSCPLCRQRVITDNTIVSTNSSSSSFLRGHSELREDSILELIIQTEEENGGTPLFCCGCSFSKIHEGKREEMATRESSIQKSDENTNFSQVKVNSSMLDKISINSSSSLGLDNKK